MKLRWRILNSGVIALSSVLTFASTALAVDVVQPRGDAAAVQGRIMKIDDAGVTVVRGESDSVFLRWDLVRDVQLDRPDPILQRYREIAANLWRARTRLERHDTTLAEPLFERLFEHYRGQNHETALLVAEGLLRCRLSRAANDLAVIPALETLRIRRALGESVNAYPSLAPVLDARTSLCPALPPAWVITPDLVRLERDLASYDAGTDTVVASLAGLYRRAVQQQLGIRIDGSQRVLAAEHPGVAFMRTIVDLQAPDAVHRRAVVASLTRDLRTVTEWEQAWIHYFIGAAMLSDAAANSRDLAFIRLSHLPARFGAVQPYLTGLALAKLIQACETDGDAAAAASLRNELATQMPQHPVLATLQHTSTPKPRAASTANQRHAALIKDTP